MFVMHDILDDRSMVVDPEFVYTTFLCMYFVIWGCSSRCLCTSLSSPWADFGFLRGPVGVPLDHFGALWAT